MVTRYASYQTKCLNSANWLRVTMKTSYRYVSPLRLNNP